MFYHYAGSGAGGDGSDCRNPDNNGFELLSYFR